jgi:hypothetical protein
MWPITTPSLPRPPEPAPGPTATKPNQARHRTDARPPTTPARHEDHATEPPTPTTTRPRTASHAARRTATTTDHPARSATAPTPAPARAAAPDAPPRPRTPATPRPGARPATAPTNHETEKRSQETQHTSHRKGKERRGTPLRRPPHPGPSRRTQGGTPGRASLQARGRLAGGSLFAPLVQAAQRREACGLALCRLLKAGGMAAGDREGGDL